MDLSGNLNNLVNGVGPNQHRVLVMWAAICSLVLAVQIPTLTSDPLTFQDEVQILDYGRVALNPKSDWSINWLVAENHPKLSTSWITVVLQELSYQLTAPSFLGSRLMTLLSGVFASTCLLGWLLTRQTPKLIAVLLALAFLCDPIFSDNYRGGRVDGWAISACLGACWLLGRQTHLNHSSPQNGMRYFLAGLLAGLSPFLWLNAALLVPLVLLELISSLTNRRFATKNTAIFLLGGLLAVSVGLLPLASDLQAYLLSIRATIEVQTQAAITSQSVFNLFAVHSPAIAIAGAIALLLHREWGLIGASLLCLAMLLQTMVYLPRVMYLLPYMCAMVAGAAIRVRHPEANSQMARRFLNYVLVFLLLHNIGISLVIRPSIALIQSPENRYEQVIEELQSIVGRGENRVLVDEWFVYHAGRELGWKQFRYAADTEHSRYLEFLKTMDFIIAKEIPITEYTVGLAEEAGFRLIGIVRLGESKQNTIEFANLEFTIPSKSYGSLAVYRKIVDESPHLQ